MNIPALHANTDLGRHPTVWLLLGDNRGDNAQVLALGRTLGWATVVKQLRYDASCAIPFRKRGPTLIGLDLARSAPLLPPWPDVIIGIGRRSAGASRWVTLQSDNQVLNIRLGRPRISLRHFDLVVSTPQYGLPASRNTMLLTLPLTLHDPVELQAAATRWLPRFGDLPRPWTAFLVGGRTSRLRFDRTLVAELVKTMDRCRDRTGGSILITTSPRTPRSVCDHLQETLGRHWVGSPYFFYRWTADTENPYKAILSAADRFVVTNDSVSMPADVVVLGKPLSVFELPAKARKQRRGPVAKALRLAGRWMEARRASGASSGYLDHGYEWLVREGIVRPPRNILAVFADLNRLGITMPVATETLPAPIGAELMLKERTAVAERIRELYAERQANGAVVPVVAPSS